MYRCESWTIKKGWALKNWFFQNVVLEKILESLMDYKEIKPVNPKGNQLWIFIGKTDAEAPILWAIRCEEPTHWKRLWCGERLRARGEGDGTDETDGWMASLTQWTWVWANSGRYWRTGKPPASMELQRVEHEFSNWATTEKYTYIPKIHTRWIKPKIRSNKCPSKVVIN